MTRRRETIQEIREAMACILAAMLAADSVSMIDDLKQSYDTLLNVTDRLLEDEIYEELMGGK